MIRGGRKPAPFLIMFTILTILFILSSVIFLPGTADNFWLPKDTVFLILGFSLIAYNFISKKEKIISFKNTWIGLILTYLVLSLGYYLYAPLVMAREGQKIPWNIWNFIPSIQAILAVILIKDLVEYTGNLERWVYIAKVLCWVCFAFCVYAILQLCGLDQIFTSKYTWVQRHFSAKMITFLGDSMHTANFVAVLSPLCLMFKNLRYKIIYALVFIVLALIGSFISMLAFWVSLLIYSLAMKKKNYSVYIILGGMAAWTLIFFFMPFYFSFSGRWEMWKTVLSGWFNRPLTGWGLGSLAVKKYIWDGKMILHPLNDYIQTLHDGGIILLVLISGYLIGLFKRIIAAKESILLLGYTISLVSFLLICSGSFLLSISPFAVIGIIYISAIEAQI